MPKIAVHIVTYNSAAVIERCLAALRTQDADYSVYIVDNASTDDTAARIRAAGYDVDVCATNGGYSAGHNRALAATTSTYVLTLNPDVLLQPGYLSAMTRVLDEQPTLGSAAGCLLRIDDFDATPQVIDSVGLFMRRNRRQGLLLDSAPLEQTPTQERRIFGPDGAAAFYRRAMLDDIAVNGQIFDQDFFMHKEDIDVCWRAQLAGWPSVYVPDAVAYHIRTFRPNHRERVDAALRMYAVRNRYLLMLKNEIPRLFWRDILRIALYDVAIIGYLVLREPRSLRAFVSAWKLRRTMLDKRRIIHAKRRIATPAMAALLSENPATP